MPLHSELASRFRFFSCSICNESVELETAKVDENGKPVHEECYVQKISLKMSIRPPPEASDAEGNSISQAINTFFTTEEARAVTNFCSVCGSRLEHRNLVFFFAGRSGEIRRSICLKCNPDPDVPSYDA
jgi:hypothetical protein